MLIQPIVLSYLQAKNIDAYAEIPANRPDEFVVLMERSSGKENHINAITIELSSYAPSKYEAAALDEKVREAMEEIIALNTISACRFGGGNYAPNSATKSYRFRSYFNLFY